MQRGEKALILGLGAISCSLMVKIILLLIGMPMMAKSDPNDLEIYHIGVGQADAVLLRSPQFYDLNGVLVRRTLLIDSGNDYNAEEVLAVLAELNITHLDFTLATHYDADHIGGFDGVLAFTGPPKVAYDRGGTYSGTQFTEYINAIGGARKTISVGEEIPLGGGCRAICLVVNGSLYGGGYIPPADENARSIVVLISYRGFDYLEGGDLTSQIEPSLGQLLTDPSNSFHNIDVYKVHHHGSDTSSDPSFLQYIRPEVSVCSVGSHGTYRHPRRITYRHLADINSYIYQTNLGYQNPAYTLNDISNCNPGSGMGPCQGYVEFVFYSDSTYLGKLVMDNGSYYYIDGNVSATSGNFRLDYLPSSGNANIINPELPALLISAGTKNLKVYLPYLGSEQKTFYLSRDSASTATTQECSSYLDPSLFILAQYSPLSSIPKPEEGKGDLLNGTVALFTDGNYYRVRNSAGSFDEYPVDDPQMPQLQLHLLLSGFYNPSQGSQVPATVDFELRDGSSPQTATSIIYQGVLDLDGSGNSSSFSLTGLDDGEYYLVVGHLNHLSVISSQKLGFAKGRLTSISFSDPSSPDFVPAYGENAMLTESDSRLSLRPGNALRDKYINISDFLPWRLANGSVPGSSNWDVRADFNGNSIVNIADFYLWRSNNGFYSFVP